MQRRQKKVASPRRLHAAAGDLSLGTGAARAPFPAGRGRAERGIDGLALFGRGDCAWNEMQIHSGTPDA